MQPEPGARRKASGLAGLLLTPIRARSHIADKLGRRWAILADSLVAGGALGVVAALAVNASGEAKLGIFAGFVAVAGVAGFALSLRRKRQPKQQNDIQP